jgi:excisionase family DNA binding protein
MTIAEAQQLPTVLSVEQAGALFGIGRRAAYDAVARGEIPAIRHGHRLLVPTAQCLTLLGIDPSRQDAGA